MPNIKRCFPAKPDRVYEQYHDQEWGKLNLDPAYLYEMLVLESFQSGLSWATILHKRTNFKRAFANWNYKKVAQFDQTDIDRLMQDAGIIRNRLKIQAAINNAQAIVQLEQSGSSLADFLTHYLPAPLINHPQTSADVPSKDQHSQQIAKALKKAGFKFVGPVTIYSFLQAVGLINDHYDWCSFKD
ncbi:MAG: DNA-3-methyladenine glycosylase I [Lactobacillus sp.]|jgi:DNA-3-methyladenine glycosylase I|nr:DNA-3-methyladenine glycosylase I [Lactobacillus sp.]MCH3906346.1 DNA-3-methyladenine glycosylase I [Lactobacillus sp.]MCH3990080.1 DNA-3-methyladenine glycosylase I [Lactobacillus sp.]MCH4069206.1 DNA-3-methyladenine glycosylase I [Lactobacillus sp.]MCI1303508.1 DNA-3-methyladenine glycosylase I [Lactobacillus sp.]